jgi:hypothetical protein
VKAAVVSTAIYGVTTLFHWSLGLSSVALCLGTLAADSYALRSRPAAVEA